MSEPGKLLAGLEHKTSPTDSDQSHACLGREWDSPESRKRRAGQLVIYSQAVSRATEGNTGLAQELIAGGPLCHQGLLPASAANLERFTNSNIDF